MTRLTRAVIALFARLLRPAPCQTPGCTLQHRCDECIAWWATK